jgi:hypothetical protein
MEYTTDRRGPDGLTREERASLRDPRTYAVAECNPCRYLVSSKTAFADFDLVIGYGRWVRITSNTGGVHDLTIGEPCSCLDKLHRAAAENCKHESVLEAVLLYRAAQDEREFRQMKEAA